MEHSGTKRIQYKTYDGEFNSFTIDEYIYDAVQVATGNAKEWLINIAIQADKENTTGKRIVSSCVRLKALKLIIKPSIKYRLK